MKLCEIFDANNLAHAAMMRDLDAFTSSPRMNLHSDTISWLKSNVRHNPMTVYRVLFLDSVEGIHVGHHFKHDVPRVSSWSKSLSVVREMATENEDLGRYAVILKASVPASSIVLDTTRLSDSDKKHIYLFDQAEVILDAGAIDATVLEIYDSED